MSNPPRRVDIRGQDHMLSYITPEEADILKFLGGSGRPGPMGIPAYDDYDPSQDPDTADFSGDTAGGDPGTGGGFDSDDVGGGGISDDDPGDSGSDEQYKSIPDPEFSPPVVAPPPAPVNTVSGLDFSTQGDSDYASYMGDIQLATQYPDLFQSPTFQSPTVAKSPPPPVDDVLVVPRTEPLFDFLSARSQSVPLTEADLDQTKRPGSYDPKIDVFDDEGDFLGEGIYDQSEFERIAGITDTNPYGVNPVAGSSTAFGRGIAQFANKLGSVIGTNIEVDKRGSLTKGQQDFIRDNAYDRYKEPFGPAKMFSTMRNFNLSPAEKAEYARQQVLQETSTPSRVVTYADKARQLGEDPSRYEQPNTIRSGLKEGDLTVLGPVVGRPRDMSDAEMVARLGIAATPLGLPLAAAENIFGLNRELGIEGQLGPDGKPFVAAEGQGGLGQLFNVATGGAGTRALDRASEIATNLINPRAGTQSAFGGVDDFGNKPPSFFERYFGGGSGGGQNQYPVGGGANEGGEPNVSDAIIRDPEGPVDGTTSDGLFGQEIYQGPKGGFIFDPVQNLPEVYARRYPRILPMSFGLGGIPTRNV